MLWSFSQEEDLKSHIAKVHGSYFGYKPCEMTFHNEPTFFNSSVINPNYYFFKFDKILKWGNSCYYQYQYKTNIWQKGGRTQCLETGPILEGPVPHLMGLVPHFRTSPISIIYKGFLNNMVKLETGFYISSKYEHYMD